MEFWADAPDLYGIGFVSPTGEVVEKLPTRTDLRETLSFVFEQTVIYVFYERVEAVTGATLIRIRMENPANGIWKLRIFQEEIFGPVVAVTTFKDEDEAIAIANDTEYGLAAGVWTRDISLAYRMGRAIKAGRVWTNCYGLHPAHAAFGGYKNSGIGRETHKMMLDHYQQTKNLLVSYDDNSMGFF